MLFLQQGAMLHAMSHGFGEQRQSQFDVDHSEPGQCTQCLAYAGASNAASGSSLAIGLAYFVAQPVARFADRITGRTSRAYFSRAPPLV